MDANDLIGRHPDFRNRAARILEPAARSEGNGQSQFWKPPRAREGMPTFWLASRLLPPATPTPVDLAPNRSVGRKSPLRRRLRRRLLAVWWARMLDCARDHPANVVSGASLIAHWQCERNFLQMLGTKVQRPTNGCDSGQRYSAALARHSREFKSTREIVR